jgi:hypothetical protein
MYLMMLDDDIPLNLPSKVKPGNRIQAAIRYFKTHGEGSLYKAIQARRSEIYSHIRDRIAHYSRINQHLFNPAAPPNRRIAWYYVWTWRGSRSLPIEWEAWFGNPEVNEFSRYDISLLLNERVEHNKVVGRFLLVNGMEVEVARPVEYTQYFKERKKRVEQLMTLF